MSIPTEKAYELLNLPLGSSKDAIEQSYKKLAVKWHPEKYANSTKNSQEALKKFKSINLAYRKLIHNDRDDKDITLTEMFDQYRQVFHNDKKKERLLNSITNNVLDINKNNSTDSNNNNQHQEINKNNLHHNNDSLKNNNNNKIQKMINNDKNNNNHEENNYENQYQSIRKDNQNIDQDLLSIKLKVKQLAIKGVELAKQNEFNKAIEKFTEAIKNDSTDHRLYGNRSYCFDKINNFEDALNDAEKAIMLDPNWPKGYFRKGRALHGLKMYKEAEEAYLKVLDIENPDDPELDEELFKVRCFQLQEMGFSKTQSESAIKNYQTVQASLEALFKNTQTTTTTTNETDKSNESCSDIDNNEYDYNENDSDYGDEFNNNSNNNFNNKKQNINNGSNKLKTITNGNTIKNNNRSNNSSNNSSNLSNGSHNNENNNNENRPNHPVNNGQPSTSLWIGNVDPNVSEDVLIEMFSAYGQLANVRCLPEKYCAFVNFKTKDDAHKALQNLQGKYLEGQRLLIKYPDNPNTALLSSLVVKKNSETSKKTVAEPIKNISNNKKKSDESFNNHNNNNNKNSTTSNNNNIDQNGLKLTGPVNGNECYFWRTTGCLYADKCRYEHIKKNKGIDKKPWHK